MLFSIVESSFVKVVNDHTGLKFFKKSALCNMLCNKERVSQDRLRRFHLKNISTQMNTPKEVDALKIDQHILKKQVLNMGDYIIVLENGNHLVGQILAFQYNDEKFKKNKKFALDYYSFQETTANSKNLGILAAIWYIINTDGKLVPIFTEDFVSISQYKFTLSSKNLLNLIELKISMDVIKMLF
jgi:hypothetical protein